MVWKSAIVVIVSVFLPFFKDTVRFAVRPEPSSVPAPGSSDITLFLCGDVMTGRGIDQVLPSSVEPRIYEPYVKDARDYVQLAEKRNGPIPQEVSYTYIWGDAMEVWQKVAPDLKIINLETSITTYGEFWPGKQIQYRMHPDNVAVLTAAGVDFCSLANNHVLDWRHPGLLETMESLRRAGIPFAGAGKDAKEAQKPAILKAGAGRVIILAYGAQTSGIPQSWAATAAQAGVNLLPDFSEKTLMHIKEQVKQVKQKGDVVVFSVHWGDNWGYEIPTYQRNFAHRLIDDAGVDLVHGHSSHHPLGIEVYKEKLIIYGAGDFINDYEGIRGHEEYRGDLALMYFPRLDTSTGKLVSLEMVPMQVRNFRLNYAAATDAAWLAEVLNREGEAFGTRVEAGREGALILRW